MAKHQEPTQECKQLTPRQALFVKSLASGATITRAAKDAGYSGKNLAQSGHQVLKTIQSKMPELMDEAGLGARELIEKYLVPLLHATTTKLFSYKGRITDWVTVPDNRTRLMAVDMVLRLWGAYAPPNQASSASEFGVRVVIKDPPRSLGPNTENAPPLCLPAPKDR